MDRCACLIFGYYLHYLDHLAPLAHLLNIPLIVSDQKIAALAKTYYPMVELVLCEDPEAIVLNYDTLIVCTPRDLFDLAFFLPQQLLKKRVTTIWCPHGNSDKGQFSLFMEGLKNEEYAFLYGGKMVDFFKQKNVMGQLKAYSLIGNYRYAFYKKYQAFYDALVPNDPFIFYAPTWQDVEKSTSYFDALPYLLSLPEHLSLVIKPHPNLPAEKIERPNTLVLTDFPPIYPLLNRLDIYIGDMSSIGYDCLAFDKPMFFLNQNNREGLYLFGCGVEVKRDQYAEIGFLIQNHKRDTYALERKKAYDYTFGPELSWEETYNRCKAVLQKGKMCTQFNVCT